MAAAQGESLRVEALAVRYTEQLMVVLELCSQQASGQIGGRAL